MDVGYVAVNLRIAIARTHAWRAEKKRGGGGGGRNEKTNYRQSLLQWFVSPHFYSLSCSCSPDKWIPDIARSLDLHTRDGLLFSKWTAAKINTNQANASKEPTGAGVDFIEWKDTVGDVWGSSCSYEQVIAILFFFLKFNLTSSILCNGNIVWRLTPAAEYCIHFTLYGYPLRDVGVVYAHACLYEQEYIRVSLYIVPLHIMSYPKIDSARKRNGCSWLRGCRLQWSSLDSVREKRKLFLVSSL